MKYVGEAMICGDSQTFGWSYYSEQLAKEHQFDVLYAEHVIDTFKDWCEHSSVEEKIQVGSKTITDMLLHPALLSMTGKACCGLISQIPEIRLLEGFADVFAEYKLATNVKNIGLNEMRDITSSLVNSETCIVRAGKSSLSWQDNARRVASSKRLANNVNANVALDRKMRALQKAQDRVKKGMVKERHLLDGRIRYYENERLAKTVGTTRGSSHVTEYNPKTGRVRAWSESYDCQGNVNRVHPKMIDGQDLIGQHYPPTGKEMGLFRLLEEGFE